jgi:hypothetical protein
MIYFIHLEKVFKFALSIVVFVPLICIELSPMISYHLADRSQPSVLLKEPLGGV